jgi:hypothetical protein
MYIYDSQSEPATSIIATNYSNLKWQINTTVLVQQFFEMVNIIKLNYPQDETGKLKNR